MDTKLEYRLMCYKAKELQDIWNPKIGDYMITVASYCGNDDPHCTESKVCKDCLDMSNIFVISGQFDFVEEIGGRHWFYGGSPCVKGDGNRMNDSHCYIMTKKGNSTLVNQFLQSSQKQKTWLPRQDQIQEMFLNGLTNYTKVKVFTEWLDAATYNPHTYSLEMLWLMFYMELKYNKQWNPISNVKEWEELKD
jgi:hypothetical protein